MINFIILAAGKGKRMHSAIPKVLCEIYQNETMLSKTISIINNINIEKNIIVVISKDISEKYFDILPKNVTFAIQKNQLGTADAVKCAIEYLNHQYNQTIVLYADVPFFQESYIFKLINSIKNLTMISFFLNKKNQYGKILTHQEIKENYEDLFEIKALKEELEFKKNQNNINICNSGIIGIKTNLLMEYIHKINNNNNTKEYYLTDIVNLLLKDNLICEGFLIPYKHAVGINSMEELFLAKTLNNHDNKQKNI